MALSLLCMCGQVKNLADPFTKGLSRDLVKSISSEMGLKPFFKKSPVMGTQPNTI
jgi:hypothetical protein